MSVTETVTKYAVCLQKEAFDRNGCFVITDVLCAADRGEVRLLCMLDLSAAFDTVDHDILIERLQQSFGVQGLALYWIESFLCDRPQAVS